MGERVKVAIAGLGNRGKDAYAVCAKEYPDKMEIVAIADIDETKVMEVAKEYHIPPEMCFSSAEELIAQEKLADVLFLCTQDRQHVKQAIPALKKGYHMLLEKPISPILEECKEILRVAQELKRIVVVCHVLRYTPFYNTLKAVIDSGQIGDVISIQAIENVGYYHQAHSFVRGNWKDGEETSPMILQKCCHDMDILLWLSGKSCRAVSSFGGLNYFKAENAPEGAAERCLDGCTAKEFCPYDAEKIYMKDAKMGVENGYTGWPLNVLALKPDKESIRKAIEEGPYGRCVFFCDNNVVDHQVVNLEMTDGTTVNFTMCAFTSVNSRYTKVMGTLGDIVADMNTNLIKVTPFGKETEEIDVSKLAENFSGHGGGDIRMVGELLGVLQGNGNANSLSSLERSMESHFIALAAEESRLSGGKVITI